MDKHFEAAWRNVGCTPTEEQWREVQLRYLEPHRKYHNLQHIANCLAELDSFSGYPPGVKLALWYHDVVYDMNRDDVPASTQVFLRHALENRLVDCDDLADAIMATSHEAPPKNDLERWVVDMDLSILGAHSVVYRKQYMEPLRKEYAGVPDPAWNTGRAGFIRGMLARPTIFSIPNVWERYESSARTNLQRELRSLDG